MNGRSETTTDAPRAGNETYSRSAITGAVWMTAQTLAARFLTLIAHWVLANRYLVEADYGIYAPALLFAGLTELVSHAGIIDVLIRRHDEFLHWARPGFWISASLGLIAIPITVLFAVIALPYLEDVDNHKTFLFLVLLLAMRAAVGGLAIVPQAKLQIEFRFRTLATLASIGTLLDIGGRILFAWWGAGPYSLAVPPLLAGAVQTIATWCASPTRVSWQPHWHLWKSILVDTATIVLASTCRRIIETGDYFILSLFVAKEVVGEYYFAFLIALQSFYLFASSLGQVFYPTLARMKHDAKRQFDAFGRSLLGFTSILAWMCFLQALLAETGVKMLFEPRWHDTVIYIQILSVAMLFSGVAITAMLYVRSQGRFDTYMRVHLVTVVIFVIGATTGAAVGGAIGVAVAITIHHLLSTIIALRVCYADQPTTLVLADVRSLTVPLLAGFATWGGGAFIGQIALPDGTWLPLQFLFLLCVGSLIFISIFWLLAGPRLQGSIRQIYTVLWQRLRPGRR